MNRRRDHRTANFRRPGRSEVVVSILVLVSLLMASPACFGQAFTANLTGVFTDSSGAVIPEVKVQLTSEATSEKRTTLAGSSGRYNFAQLLPGSYELSAEAAGFKKVCPARHRFEGE